jgi:hypothetical protein
VRWLFLVALPFKLANDASQFIGPIFLNLLLTAISNDGPVLRSYSYAAAMFAGLVGGALCESQFWQRSMRAGFRLRACLIAAIYRCFVHLTSSSVCRRGVSA